MNTMEMAEVLKTVDMYELAAKTNAGYALSENEATAVAELDRQFKKIGEEGHDPNHEISAFIRRTINEEITNAPDDLLDQLFERGTLDENDDYEAFVTPKNTLVAYEAAKGGNVDRSFLDVSVLTPTYRNKQIETDITYAELRKNGWKTVSLLTEYAMEALKNCMFKDIFDVLDAAITSGAGNYITEATTKPTQASMDAMALYLMEHEDRAKTIVGLTKYIQAASKLSGFVSDDMKNEVHRNGLLGTYDSCDLYPIKASKKFYVNGTPSLQIPDYRLFGIAGAIGRLDMKGDTHVYQDEDNNKEKLHIMIKDFTYGYSFNNDTLEKVCKMVIAQS